jgi:hypothetical protein
MIVGVWSNRDGAKLESTALVSTLLCVCLQMRAARKWKKKLIGEINKRSKFRGKIRARVRHVLKEGSSPRGALGPAILDQERLINGSHTEL